VEELVLFEVAMGSFWACLQLMPAQAAALSVNVFSQARRVSGCGGDMSVRSRDFC
jgi:hypothetical protein